MRWVLALVAIAAAAGCPEPPPNVVLILADDMGYEMVEAYGGRSYATPELDRLAEAGMRFEHAYAQPLCTPTRVKLLTGRSNLRNYEGWGKLPRGETTFAHLLRRRGYRTLMAGKWQLDRDGGQSPAMAGFHEHIAFEAGDHTPGSRYWDPELLVDGVVRRFDGAFGPDVVTDHINDFMERHRDEPFLVYYPMLLPHEPHVATPDAPDAESPEERFAAMVAYADKMVGKVVAQLDALGLRDDTVVFFLADNGAEARFVSELADGTLVRGGKGLPAAAGTRVPLIASWPGRIEPGSVVPTLVDVSVIFPTLRDLAGLPATEEVDGWSIAGLLLGQDPDPRDWIYAYHRPGDALDLWRAEFAQLGPYKLYRGKGLATDTASVIRVYRDGWLYDVSADARERRPIRPGEGTPEQEQVRARLEEILAAFPGR